MAQIVNHNDKDIYIIMENSKNKTNEFATMKRLVKEMLDRYHQIRKECGISDKDWNVRTIDRLAQPFLKGYFTIAIVGKVSSGKSTFINALLGCKNLLPTGHDQTTCGLTYIEYGETPQVTITFGDGHQIIIDNDIAGKIKDYVAIPDEYHNLPVNNIDDMIMGGFDFDKIWDAKKVLEDTTLCAKIDKELLKKYVQQRSKKNIATEVHLKYPFNEELKGWRIIDTPGIGAIGGIETRTQQLLNLQKEDGSREVDAIVFLQDGSQTLDETQTKKFVIEQLNNFSEADKRRLFFVLTHSGDSDFRCHQDSKLNFIRQNYGDKIHCLTYGDSLLYSFISELEESDVDLKLYDEFEQPEGWPEDEWDAIMTLLFQAKQSLVKSHDTINHDTMYRTITDWAHFEDLKKEINKFAREEKLQTLNKFVNLIAIDYTGFNKQLKRDSELVDGNIERINQEIAKTKAKRAKYNKIAHEVDQNIRIEEIKGQFNFIDDELQNFKYLTSIPGVRNAITNLFDRVQYKEKNVFNDIIAQYSENLKDRSSIDDITIESIDFESIVIEAEDRSRETYVVKPREVKKQSSGKEEEIPAKYGTRINDDEKLRQFKALAIQKARRQRDVFLRQIKEKADNIRDNINNELDEKIKAEVAHFEQLKLQLSQKERYKEHNNIFREKAHCAGRELLNLVNEYNNEK